MPDVAELARPPDRALGAAADPDLRLRRRVWLRRRVLERPPASLEFALPVPEGPHHADRLVAAPAAPFELDADEVELVFVPAHPDAEDEAAAGELLQRRDLLSEVHRVVQRHEHDRGAEPDPFRPAGDPAERDERVVDAAVRVDRLQADDDVLRGPDRVELELLGGLDDTAVPARDLI